MFGAWAQASLCLVAFQNVWGLLEWRRLHALENQIEHWTRQKPELARQLRASRELVLRLDDQYAAQSARGAAVTFADRFTQVGIEDAARVVDGPMGAFLSQRMPELASSMRVTALEDFVLRGKSTSEELHRRIQEITRELDAYRVRIEAAKSQTDRLPQGLLPEWELFVARRTQALNELQEKVKGLPTQAERDQGLQRLRMRWEGLRAQLLAYLRSGAVQSDEASQSLRSHFAASDAELLSQLDQAKRAAIEAQGQLDNVSVGLDRASREVVSLRQELEQRTKNVIWGSAAAGMGVYTIIDERNDAREKERLKKAPQQPAQPRKEPEPQPTPEPSREPRLPEPYFPRGTRF